MSARHLSPSSLRCITRAIAHHTLSAIATAIGAVAGCLFIGRWLAAVMFYSLSPWPRRLMRGELHDNRT